MQYDNVMPSHQFLTDEQIATVLTYIRQNFENNAPEITIDMVKNARQPSP